MHEYGAAEPGTGRVVIVPDDDDDIVEIILAPHIFVRCLEGKCDQPVVIAMRRVVAPTVVAGQGAYRQAARRQRQSVGAIKHLAQEKSPYRSDAIAFALRRLNADAPQGARILTVLEAKNAAATLCRVNGQHGALSCSSMAAL